jgi:hypothetical protein
LPAEPAAGGIMRAEIVPVTMRPRRDRTEVFVAGGTVVGRERIVPDGPFSVLGVRADVCVVPPGMSTGTCAVATRYGAMPAVIESDEGELVAAASGALFTPERAVRRARAVVSAVGSVASSPRAECVHVHTVHRAFVSRKALFGECGQLRGCE